MKRMIAIAAVAMILFVLIGTASAFAEETVAFEATFNQSELISIDDCSNGVCSVVFQGRGAANIMGSMTWTFDFVQDFNITPCSPATGVITLKGESGTITLSDTAFVCLGPSPSTFPNVISSSWAITGGTGEFEGITGSGTSQGVIGGNGPVVHYSGTVSY